MPAALEISPDLRLPLDAATQTFAFIARKGAGKTYAAGKLAECLLDAGVQVVTLDSVGNWWGLRLMADGKTPAYDIAVIGGLRGDIPLEVTGGHLIAEIVPETGRSLIIDISQFSKSDRQRFATAFAERLWQAKKAERHPTPVHLIIEESQLIVPERVDSGAAKMVGIYEEIIRLGRNYGIGVSMISQRPQSVNKEVLNQTECLFALQVNGKHERLALRDWIVHHGAEKSLVDELPGLPVGTAYVWSPQWLQILQKVRVGQKKTFDASATPKVGSAQVRRDLKPINLEDLKTRMASTIEKAKANDPNELRKEITSLKKELVKAQSAKPASAQTKTIEKPVLKDGQLARAEKIISTVANLSEKLEKVADEIWVALGKLNTNGHKPHVESTVTTPSFPAHPTKPLKIQSARIDSPEVLRGGLRRMLIALAQRPSGLSVRQLGVRAQLSSSSGTFTTYLSKGRQAGWIVGGRDRLQITEGGLANLGQYQMLPEGQDLLEYWLNELGGGAARMLRALADIWPQSLSRSDLGERAELSPGSGTFTTYLSRLRTLELIEGTNEIKASEEFFT